MPYNAPMIKQTLVNEYGGEITFCEPTMKSRQDKAKQIQHETKSQLIHSSNDENVISGAGSLGIEFIQQCPQLDCILAPVGGGGLLSGIALSLLNYHRKISVIGCEPHNANDAYQGIKTGDIVIHKTYPNTIADGLRTNLGSLTFPIIHEHVDKIVCVKEEEIIEGMRCIYERLKIVIEPSSAVAVAVLSTNEFRSFVEEQNIKNIGVVLTGGNVDFSTLKTLF